MTDSSSPGEATRQHFAATAEYWSAVYESPDDLAGFAYRERLDRALFYVDQLGLPAGAAVADVGAGAGLGAVALARRGFTVTAVDSTTNMLEMTKDRAEQAGVRVDVLEADAEHLPLPSASQDLVLALGLLPWVVDPHAVLREFRRVLRDGGALVASADNRWRLTEMFDPALSPLATPLRRLIVPTIRRRRGGAVHPIEVRRHSLPELRRLLVASGFRVVTASTVGYGPPTFMRRAARRDLASAFARLMARKADTSKLLARLGVHVVVSATTSPLSTDSPSGPRR